MSDRKIVKDNKSNWSALKRKSQFCTYWLTSKQLKSSLINWSTPLLQLHALVQLKARIYRFKDTKYIYHRYLSQRKTIRIPKNPSRNQIDEYFIPKRQFNYPDS